MGNLFSITGIYRNEPHGILPFGGFMLRDEPPTKRTFVGRIADYFDMSEISGEFSNEDEIEFEKRYSSGKSLNYHLKFNKDTGLLSGEYVGNNLKVSGEVVCEIHPSIKSIVLNLELRYQHPEEQAESLLKSMVDEGYLRTDKDKNGRDIVLPGKDPDGPEEDIPF